MITTTAPSGRYFRVTDNKGRILARCLPEEKALPFRAPRWKQSRFLVELSPAEIAEAMNAKPK